MKIQIWKMENENEMLKKSSLLMEKIKRDWRDHEGLQRFNFHPYISVSTNNL